MNKNGHVKDLGKHGSKSKAPKELEEVIRTLIRTIFKRDLNFQAFCIDRRLPQGDYIVKAVRTEKKSVVIQCWPTDEASIGGRTCFIYLDDQKTVDHLFEEIHDLVSSQELRRHNWDRYIRDGRLANPIEEQWTTERLNALTGVMLGCMVQHGPKQPTAIVNAVLGVLEIGSLTQDQLEKHFRYLDKHEWIKVRPLGNNPQKATVWPGRKMIRLYAQETGAIELDDSSEEALDRFIENGRWLQTEASRCMAKIADATSRLPKAESRLLRAQIELENAQKEYDKLQAAVSESNNSLSALHDISLESQPVLHRMVQELKLLAPQVVHA